MNFNEVIQVIGTERQYQELMEQEPDSHVITNFNLGDALLAIEFNLEKAKEAKYPNIDPEYKECMEYLRKVAAICVKMGEKYGMPKRDVPVFVSKEPK